MYKLLLVLASAQALKRPQQRALAVRGGEIDPITIGKGVVLASGLYGAFDPKGNLDKYGIKAEPRARRRGAARPGCRSCSRPRSTSTRRPLTANDVPYARSDGHHRTYV